MEMKLIISQKEHCLIRHMSENVDLMDIQQLATTCQLGVYRALEVINPVGVLQNGKPNIAMAMTMKNFLVEFVDCKLHNNPKTVDQSTFIGQINNDFLLNDIQ